jgi:hypothetical protein
MAVPELSSSGIPQTEAEILARLYKDAAARLKKIILHPPGPTQISQEYAQARAAQQLRQVDDAIQTLKVGTAKWVSVTADPKTGKETKPSPIIQAARDGIARANMQAAEVGVQPSGSAVEGSFNLFDSGAIRIIAAQMVEDLGKAQASLKGRADRLIRATAQEKLSESEIHKIIAGGIIEGKPAETIRQLRKALEAVHGEKVQIIDKNGSPMELDSGDYAEMVVRTQTRDVLETARHERLQSVGLDLVSVVGKASRNFCSSFLRQVFSLSGTSAKYPALASLPGGGPPFHPNCSKSTRPFVEELATEKQLRLADGLDDARKLIGMDTAQAQRAFNDLQIHAQLQGRAVR